MTTIIDSTATVVSAQQELAATVNQRKTAIIANAKPAAQPAAPAAAKRVYVNELVVAGTVHNNEPKFAPWIAKITAQHYVGGIPTDKLPQAILYFLGVCHSVPSKQVTIVGHDLDRYIVKTTEHGQVRQRWYAMPAYLLAFAKTQATTLVHTAE